MLQKIKDWMMPLAMLTGGIFYNFFGNLSWVTPYLIFFMLLFTFSKLSPKGIRFSKLHIVLLTIQLVTGGIAYYALRSYDPVLAQGAMICFMAPTATSAAVITGMLNGNIAFLTSFTLLSNLGVALMAPAMFPLVGNDPDLTFWDAFFRIFIKVFPLLIMPLLTAWGIRFLMPRLQKQMLNYPKVPFYLWVFALMVVTGRTVSSLMNAERHDFRTEFLLALIAFLICCAQFALGKWIGSRYDNRIACGQSLGQKNTILAIWMTQAFLNPVASLAPATYVLWQNIINSYQLWKTHQQKRIAEKVKP